MKNWIILAGVLTLCSCTARRELQMNMVDVELVRIDTVQRYPNTAQIVLTWRSRHQVDYVTYEAPSGSYSIGARMKVLVKK